MEKSEYNDSKTPDRYISTWSKVFDFLIGLFGGVIYTWASLIITSLNMLYMFLFLLFSILLIAVFSYFKRKFIVLGLVISIIIPILVVVCLLGACSLGLIK